MPIRSPLHPFGLRLLGVLCALVLILSLFLSACNLPLQPVQQPETGDKDLASTHVAQTIQADPLYATVQARERLLTAQALQAPPTPSATPLFTLVPSPTSTSLIPSTTPSPSATLSLTPTLTSIGLPRIVATIETNCRLGPGADFARVGYLLVGQESTVHGRNPEETWWYIANPNSPGEYCWVWGETTVVTGDITALEIITPPALPADFELNFSGLKNCGGVATLAFKVVNTGGEIFRSSRIRLWNIWTSSFIGAAETSNSPFRNKPCGGGNGKLEPNSGAYVTKSLNSLLTPGTKVQATVELCTKSDGGGECIEKKTQFEFP